MPLDVKTIESVLRGDSDTVWRMLVSNVHAICREKIDLPDPEPSIRDREMRIAELDDLVCTSAWDLWNRFQLSVPSTAAELKEFWTRPHEGKAILILDGLSLRELPHIIQGAEAHGLKVVADKATASEFPPETDPFASAMGFSSRASLRNNPSSRFFPNARTNVSDMDWSSCANMITPDPNWILWHQLPDDRLHALEGDSNAIGRLSRELADHLRSDAFWALAKKLATGRTLIITSDHGYAFSGNFLELQEGPTEFLRENFKGRRSLRGDGAMGTGSPPLAMRFDTDAGPYRLALGRRRWRVPGGFPKLTHGGLTLFEVLSPYVEIKE